MLNDSLSGDLCIICRMHFNAAHRLYNPKFSNEKNFAIFGKCNNENGHGHNYVIEIYVKGSIDPETGFIINLSDLKAIIDKEIIQECDHKNLNLDVTWLKNVIPTTENLVIAFWKRIKNKISKGKLYKIRLYETENNIAEYSELN
ncbi:MAG: 6-carboxytetrahydropterin synthase [Candidatus Protochlamydia sp.]|nr:6-carboxytetrahydropterin synthase [Candidatus Protochlamydia sp.]